MDWELQTRNEYKILAGKLLGKFPLGISIGRVEDSITRDPMGTGLRMGGGLN
jgi:hypothetical protein